MDRKFSISIILMICFCLNQACQKSDATEACQVSFSNDLLPILETKCTGYCHASFDHYTEYINLKEVVDNGLLNEKVVVLKTMPLEPENLEESLKFTEDERALFACWIEAGGPNN